MVGVWTFDPVKLQSWKPWSSATAPRIPRPRSPSAKPHKQKRVGSAGQRTYEEDVRLVRGSARGRRAEAGQEEHRGGGAHQRQRFLSPVPRGCLLLCWLRTGSG